METQEFCNKCKQETYHTILHQEKESYEDGGGWWEENLYEMVKCGGCKEISFRKLHQDVQMMSNFDYESGLPEPYEFTNYPKRMQYLLELKRFHNTPKLIIKIYKEIIETYNNQLYILCGGGIRAIIEGICSDKGIQGIQKLDKNNNPYLNKSLPSKIKGLAENGFLTTKSAESLHNLTFMGNESLHQLAASSKYELKLAIDIIEHMLESIYEIEHKSNNLKNQIAQRKSRP